MAIKRQEGQLGLFKPESDWTPPSELPDLRRYPIVALDSETRDDGLSSGRGPGWCFGPAGWLAGVSYAAPDGTKGYVPVRHPETENFPLENVIRWLTDIHRSETRCLYFNSPYDIGWLGSYGVPSPNRLEDALAAEVMVDENQYEYGLDAVCARYGIEGKDTSLLRDAVDAYGGDIRKPSASLWRLPARYAGPYAEQDAVATLELFNTRLEPQLIGQEVVDAYRLEMDLVPMVVAMRRRGIRINTDRAIQTAKHFRKIAAAAVYEVGRRLALGRQLTIEDLRSPVFLERIFTTEGVPFPRTEKTQRGSFSIDWMEKFDHWLPKLVVRATKYEEAATKFIDNYLLSYAHRGRVHAEVHQFRGEDGGTRSHRFSYSSPPLQQMTSPDKDPQEPDPDRPGKTRYIENLRIGFPLRDVMEPEIDEAWCAADYSQQEPRLTVHFASVCRCQGAELAVDRYRSNPRTDYHTMVAEMTNLPRSRAKILNLGMTYGKGKRSLAQELNLSLEEAEAMLNDYHSRLPFIKSLETFAKNRASDRGYIRLIDGARMRYPFWEGPWIDPDVKSSAIRSGFSMLPGKIEEIRERIKDKDHPWHGKRLRRADTRKALNNLVQGSAARQTKIAMRNMWREGILPLIQMHDEVGFSTGERAVAERVAEIMRDAVTLRVPVIVDLEVGKTWGRAKQSAADFDWSALKK